MRAGLLSQPRVIKHLNENFVNTWILRDDLKALAKRGDGLAQLLSAKFEPPVDMYFLSSTGQIISKLNSFQDFLQVHPDVSSPRFVRGQNKKLQSAEEVFFDQAVNQPDNR